MLTSLHFYKFENSSQNTFVAERYYFGVVFLCVDFCCVFSLFCRCLNISVNPLHLLSSLSEVGTRNINTLLLCSAPLSVVCVYQSRPSQTSCSLFEFSIKIRIAGVLDLVQRPGILKIRQHNVSETRSLSSPDQIIEVSSL
jgi:hypothetical protein